MSKVKAELIDLGGKYYGTEIALSYGQPGNVEYDTGGMSVWFGGNHKPSKREVAGYVWRNNRWEQWDTFTNEWYPYEVNDSHYETQTSLEIAEVIVAAINNHKEWS